MSPSSLFTFYQQCVDRGHEKQWHCVPVFNHQTETCSKATEKKREDDTEVGLGSGWDLTDLMRGTLSSVQHNVGPLCKYSSSSHDWLYNLEKIQHTQKTTQCSMSKGSHINQNNIMFSYTLEEKKLEKTEKTTCIHLTINLYS